MKRNFILTENQYKRLIKKFINESYSEEDLKYTHPVSGKECKIKVAKNNHTDLSWNRYSAVLVCDLYEDGKESVVATLSITGNSPEKVKKFVCDNIELVYSELDEMMSDDIEYELNEDFNPDRWEVIDEPIKCDLE